MVNNNLIMEKRDGKSLVYIIRVPGLFLSTSYKVLKAHKNEGFVKCNKLTYNGREKLLYDISKYRTMEDMMPSLFSDTFLIVLLNLFEIILQVKNNGFMRCENLQIAEDKIFIDPNNYRVFLVYLPIENKESQDGYLIFEQELKIMLQKLIDNNKNIINADVITLRERLEQTYRIEDLYSMVKNRNMKRNTNYNSSRLPNQKDINKSLVNQNIMQKNINKSLLNQNTMMQNKVSQNTMTQNKVNPNTMMQNKVNPNTANQIFNNNDTKQTENVKRFFWNRNDKTKSKELQQALLVSTNTKIEIRMIIERKDFVIGKMKGEVDGVIENNSAISRMHCKIVNEKDSYYIIDLGSTNGTYVNDVRVKANDRVEIRYGDRIRLANVNFAFMDNN